MGGPNGNSTNNKSNHGGIGDIPTSGRELAIEALIDLDPRGPIYRINRILNEDANAASAARPNKITKSALLDAALMFSKYQHKSGDYLPQPNQYPNNAASKSFDGIDNCGNSDSGNGVDIGHDKTVVELFKDLERDPLNNDQRERVMRHFAKAMLAKAKDNTLTSGTRSSSSASSVSRPKDGTRGTGEKVEEKEDEHVKVGASTATTVKSGVPNIAVSTYPPPQLMIVLRKIYGSGSSSSDRLDELEDSDSGGSTTSSTSSILSNLIQTIVEHPIFSNKIPTSEAKNDDGEGVADEERTVKKMKMDDTNNDETCDITMDENEIVDSKQQQQSHERKSSFGNDSPVTNLEAIVGNACHLVSESSSDSGNDDKLVGILIAALSMLTSCITSVDDKEATNLDSMASNNKDHLNSLQVGGPLSLHVDTLKKSSCSKDEVLNSQCFSELLLHPTLMNYFIDAASIHEEREEMKSTKVAAAEKLEVNKTDSKKETDDSKDRTDITDDNEVSEANTETSNIDGTGSNDQVPAAPEQEEDERECQEPHGYSFIGEEYEEEDDEEDNSSSQDDEEEEEEEESSVSTTSRDDNGDDQVEDSENANNEQTTADQTNSVSNEDREVVAGADKERTPSLKKAEIDQAHQTEEVLLLQALKLSYGDPEQSLPQLPAYPKEEYHPKDISVLNPSLLEHFGKLSAPTVIATLLRLAIVQSEKQEKGSSNCGSAIHIIVAILHTLSTSRVETTKVLIELVDKLNVLNGNESKDAEQITEDEDPAFGTTPRAASARSTSASLKEKGMIRKAAAAAHSVSIQQEKIQQDIENLKESLTFYSLSSFLVMKCLRNILQQIILSPTHQKPFKLSMVTRVRLTACLSSYMSTALCAQMKSLFSYYSDVEQLFIPRLLLFEAASLWGECAPLIFSSANDLESQLTRSLRQCFPSSFDVKADNLELRSQKDVTFPWSEVDSNFLKLNSMCKRMRCEEILDCFVTAPKAYSKSSGPLEQKGTFISIHTMLSKICMNHLHHYDPSVTTNVSGLFYAFHARCTEDLLLWRNVDSSALHSSFNESSASTESVEDESKVVVMKKLSFCFDNSKCADSIALIPSNTSNAPLIAHQRASKVWGTVFSTTAYEPKSGVHRWAVRLDKCERGHVFVGVVTSRASKKTYVGGDKYGWGVIGTQALWHERRKVRSDYGNTFRTGATVIVTLDTDSGTLRFGILHNSQHPTTSKKSSPFEIDRSPYSDGRLDDSSGYVEDWGIAFEGLPLDATLFPAVGLYQRDDKVTLLSVAAESNGGCGSPLLNDLVCGSAFYPETSKQQSENESEGVEIIDSFREWNSNVCGDGIKFASNVFEVAIQRLQSPTVSISEDDFFQGLLPSVISSLALYPGSIPVLSGRFSLTLLPLMCKCLDLIEEKIDSKSTVLNPTEHIKPGKWTIHATPCTTSLGVSDEIEEYVVDLEYCDDKLCFKGNGIGTGGKSINCKVSIVGAVNGSLIQFVEEWEDENDESQNSNLSTSSCVVEAESNIFGTRFEGQYTNVHFGQSGSISGILETPGNLQSFQESQQCLVSCSAMLGMAVSHISSILSSGAPKNDVGPKMNQDFTITKDNLEELQLFVDSSPILSQGLTIQALDDAKITMCTQNVLSYFLKSEDEAGVHDVFSYWKDLSLSYFSQSKEVHALFNDDTFGTLEALDTELAPSCGGYGSLSMLEPEVYKKCRQKIISVLLHHTGQRNPSLKGDTLSNLSSVWQTALQIIETGVRSTLFQLQDGDSRKKGCLRYCKLADSISNFLIKLIPLSIPLETALKSISEIYTFATRQKDVLCFAEIIESRNRRDLLRFLGLRIIQKCVVGNVDTICTLESLISSWYQSNQEFDRFLRKGEIPTLAASKYKSSSDKLHQMKYNILSTVCLRLTDLLTAQNAQDRLSVTALQSLSITILPTLFVASKSNVAHFPGSTVWNYIQALIAECQKAVHEQDQNENDGTDSVIIRESMGRSARFNVMNSITSILHLYLYLIQGIGSTLTKDEAMEVTSTPVKIVKDELKRVLKFMEGSCKSTIDGQKFRKAGADCDLWISKLAKDSDYCVERVCKHVETSKKFSTGINFISMKENWATTQPQSQNNVEPAMNNKQATYLSERYFVRLLNTFSSLAHSEIFPHWINKDDEWIELLINFVTCKRGISSPFRLRMRVIRLLRIILPKASPSVALVQKLFSRIGTILLALDINSAEESPEVEYIEAKEFVSLLRTIHNNNTSKEDDLDWRGCIYKAIDSNSDAIVHGFHAYLGGIPDKVSIGSCVLLKPSAAANISAASSQISLKHSTSKSKSNFESMSPVAASCGAEGIIAGLCRREALAGRISDVDVKGGVCEIVLFDRQERVKFNKKKSFGSISIRAVKVPCQEIVAADEIALLIDERLLKLSNVSIPLIRGLNAVSTVLNQSEEMKSENEDSDALELGKLIDAIFSTRTGSVVLSNPSLLGAFLRENAVKDSKCMYKLLEIASLKRKHDDETMSHCNSACEEGLGSLAEYHSRFWYLRGLLSEVRQRKVAFNSVAFAKLCETSIKSVEKDNVDTPSKDKPDDNSFVTPPGSFREDSNITSDSIDESAHRQESGIERTGFQANSAESSNDNDEEESNEEEANAARLAEETEAAHLREAAIVQMAELGLPRSWSEYALRRVGGTNIEAAVHFCLERGGDMERLLLEEEERNRRSNSSSSRRQNSGGGSGNSHLLRQLVEMGFPPNWCAEALSSTGHNVDEALTWMIRNGERLSALDEGVDNAEDDDGDNVDGGDSDEDEGNTKSQLESGQSEEKKENKDQYWKEDMVCPLRSISGRTNIDHRTLEISGLPSGGFSSVGMKGTSLESGKWYYEAELITDGCLQIGWADSSFSGHCQAERGDGCGDGPSSWAFDGWRRYRWHSTATEWGCRWTKGDIVGCLLDMDKKEISFTLNGRGEDIGMGLAFSGDGFRPCGGVYACVSFNRKEKIRLVLGGSGTDSFNFPPPPGYRGVGEIVHDLAEEREVLLKDEEILLLKDTSPDKEPTRKPYICDFSDGEHGYELFAWQHRYYGSDASVHLGGQGKNKHSRSRLDLGASLKDPAKSIEDVYCGIIDSYLEKEWSKKGVKGDLNDHKVIVDHINGAYDAIIGKTEKEFYDVGLAICILYARKLIMHIIMTLSSGFDISLFLASQGTNSDDIARKVLVVLERCCGLHAAGWVGEAGAMAVASEALGLAISSHERNSNPFSSFLGGGSYKVGRSNGDKAHLPTAALSQFLSTAKLAHEGTVDDMFDPSLSLASCAEAALGGDVGGSIVFIKNALQHSAACSTSMIKVLLAKIRQSVRVLSSMEYYGSSPNQGDSDNEEDDDDEDDDSHNAETNSSSLNNGSPPPDARLTLFLTGLLLSKPVSSALESLESDEISSQSIADSLFLTWSIGLLSASAPWRMISAMTVSSILSLYPRSFCTIPSSLPTIKKYYSRFYCTVARRIWAERSAIPICSRYVQSFVDLSCSIRNAIFVLKMDGSAIPTFDWWVDAATPISIQPQQLPLTNAHKNRSWESNEGWVNCDDGWEVWTGELEYHSVDWMAPSRSAVRSLTDGGDGPPMLREGCTVVRGLDWNQDGSGLNHGDDDGKELYEKEKEKINELKDVEADEEEPSPKKKVPSPKLPVGSVLSIEPWKGIPGAARRVKWHLTDKEGVYRFGGDGGRYDIAHVDVNEKSTRIKKRYPLPESAEQCAARYGFGINRKFSIILRLQQYNENCEKGSNEEGISRVGILEMPDFGAGILVDCDFYEDGAVAITEKRLLYGSKDSGWHPRFGQPSYVPGTTIILTGTKSSDDLVENSSHEMLLGSSSHTVQRLRNREDGGKVRVTSEMRLLRDKSFQSLSNKSLADDVSSPQLPPIHFDRDFHAASMNLSHDCRTLTCSASDGRCVAFGSVGFTKGIHYWEVKIEQADTGSVFIGVAEKPPVDTSTNSTNPDYKSRLNRWLGCGFVNFRATYSAGSERVYGAHCHAGDTIGVLLDCDAGRLSFFLDGVKYGEHIMNDLGCAYENISPFGFNADGSGSSGAGQGAPNGSSDRGHSRSGSRYPSNGAVQPKALWPVVGMRHVGDRVTFSSKWITSHGVDPSSVLKNALIVDEIFSHYESISKDSESLPNHSLPIAFVSEAYDEYKRWKTGRWRRFDTRGSGGQHLSSSGLEIDVDTSPLSCAMACASIGLTFVLLPGDRVRVKRSSGRLLELPEEAIILGAYQGRLWYQIYSQKSEGGSLSEGGGRAWFWDESEVVGDSLQIIGRGKAHNIELPLLNRFTGGSPGGLKIIYSEGAVVRLDLEIFEGSEAIGTIPHGTVIPNDDVLERRMNSCGVVRYRVRLEEFGEGWISSRIRGGKEDAIIEHNSSSEEVESDEIEVKFYSPRQCAEVWLANYDGLFSYGTSKKEDGIWSIPSLDEFNSYLHQGIIDGMSAYESDSFLTSFVTATSNLCAHGNGIEVTYDLISSLLYTSMKSHSVLSEDDDDISTDLVHDLEMNSSIASMFVGVSTRFPSMKSLLARIAMLKAFNRRAKYALPWLLSRPPQESSAVLGGLSGLGASIERCGKSQQDKLKQAWVCASSTGGRIRDHRSILFDSVKREYLQCIMDCTTTPTPLSHDEYELPREVRTVRVNRVKARNAMVSTDNVSKKKHSVFSQLQNETRGWSGAALRRGHVAKGHGGQRRAFKVKLVGEGVNDYSGPYREVFADAVREITSVDNTMCSALGVLKPSPNQVADIGEDRNLFIFSFPSSTDDEQGDTLWDLNISDEERLIRSHYSCYTIPETEEVRDTEESISFLGKLASTAVRHGILVDLPLPQGSVWGPLCEDKYDELNSLKEIDLLSSRYLAKSKKESNMLIKQRRMLNAFAEGISSVMPLEVFSIFSASQLIDFYCGNSDIDVDLLQKIVEYEGYNKTDQVIQYFWEVLREMTSEERKLFLQFVWARTRLPLKESDFEDPFKILKDTKSEMTGKSLTALPSASTCFFSLTLPQYSDKETLRQKLLFAINNVTTMESDYVTNDAEVREGWRGM